MYAVLKIVDSHTLLLLIMINAKKKHPIMSAAALYFLADFVDLSFAVLFLPRAALAPAFQTSLGQIKSLRAANITSTERNSVFFTGA